MAITDFINTSTTIGQIMLAGSQNVTGSDVGTFAAVVIFLIAMALMFQIPLEFLVVIILPLCIGVSAYYSNFIIAVVVIIIYVASLIAKNWLFR